MCVTHGVMQETPVYRLEVQSWSKYRLCHWRILLEASFLSSESFIFYACGCLPGSQDTGWVNKKTFYGRTPISYIYMRRHRGRMEQNAGSWRGSAWWSTLGTYERASETKPLFHLDSWRNPIPFPIMKSISIHCSYLSSPEMAPLGMQFAHLLPTLVHSLREPFLRVWCTPSWRPDIFSPMMVIAEGQNPDAHPQPHLGKDTHSWLWAWCWAVKHSVSVNSDQHPAKCLRVSCCMSVGTRSLDEFWMPLPISDKEDEWFAVFSLISGCFSQPGGHGLFPHQYWHVRTREEAWPAWAGLLLVNQACEIWCGNLDFKECTGSLCQGCSQLLIYNHFWKPGCKI